MFPALQEHDDLLFDIPSGLIQDLIENVNGFSEDPSTRKKKRRSKSDVHEEDMQENVEGGNVNEGKLRKMVHRDIERQRRQEMAELYASLRSLLPLEHIRGKRSISDHMHEAMNYIKKTEKSIEELRMRRDKLKEMSSSSPSENGRSSGTNSTVCVDVSSCRDGVEILISCGLTNGDMFPLSRVLIELLKRGLNVVSCVSTRTDQGFVYRIQSEVNEMACLDLPGLQQRLLNVING